MAEENKVDLLMSVDLDASETLKTIAALRTETSDLRKEQKKLDRTTAEGAVEYERLNTQIKANTKTIQQYEKQIVNTMTQEKAQDGSIKSLRAELSNAKAAYAELSKTEREGAKGRELLDKTAALNAELKELEAAYGDNQRKVGEYENAGKSLRTELRDLVEQMATLAVNGQKDSEIYAELAQRASTLKDAQADVNAQITQMASDTVAFDTMLQGAQALTAAYGVWKSTSAALGIENEALEQTMQKMVVVMGALQSLQTLQNLAQKQSNIYRAAANVLQKIGIKQTTAETVATSANVAVIKAEAIAENASTAAKTKGVVVTKLITAAQWLWNAAMSANPVMILVIAVAALIAGIAALIGWMSKESQAAKDAKAAQEAYNIALEESEARSKKLENAYANSVRERNLATRSLIEQMRAEGKTQQEIDAVKRKSETDLRNMEIEYQKQRQKETQDLIALKEKELASWVKAQSQVREGGKRWKKYAEEIKNATAALDEHRQSLADTDLTIRETMQDEIDATREAEKAQTDAAKSAADAAKARVDAAISAYEKELDAQRKFNEAMLKAEAGFQSDDMKTRQSYAQKIFALNQATERAKLDNLRKNNRITEAEYAQSLAVMGAQLTEFNNGQIKELNDFFDSERKAILGMLTQTLDEQIADVEKKYTEAVKRLEAIEPPSILPGEDPAVYAARLAEYEAFALEQANIAIQLEEQRDAEIAKLRDTALAAQIKQIEEGVKEGYESDLAQFQNNERKKLDVTEKMLREQIAKKKAAGIETYNEEAQLENVRMQRVALNLNRELISAEGNAKKIHTAKQKALEAELAAAEGNADAILEINARMAENDRELAEARIAAAGEWLSAAADLLNSLNGLFNAGLEKQSQDIQEKFDKDQLALSEARAKGALTEAQYNNEVLKLEKQKEKEEAKLERKKAIRERASKVFSVVTDTAMGIVKAAAASPLTGGLPFSAIVAAIGALNLATILSEPLPKAARGGLITGPSHRAGGTIIEAEGGEAIISRRAVSMFGPVLSALNELGGGVPFAGPLSDGGYTLRSASNAANEDITDAIRNLQIYTIIDDINRGQEQFAKIQDRGVLL